MGDHFKYFIKPEDRRSNKVKKKAPRKWNIMLTLGNLTFLLLVIFLVYRPAMQRLENKELMVDQYLFKVSHEITESNFFVDVYILNKGDMRDFSSQRLKIVLVGVDNKEHESISDIKSDEILDQNQGKHFIYSYSLSEMSKNAYIRIYFDNKVIYESETIKLKD
jgi:flagellar biosynthesis/type III secretory pathway M-ring protein FliF/YscJ